MRVRNLHTAPRDSHLIKIRTFLKKIDSYLKKLKKIDSYLKKFKFASC